MASSAATTAPWDGVPSEDQLFVLVTGANSGIGLGIGQRLIDEFLALRPPSAHLVLVTTTRSAAKSKTTTDALRQYLQKSTKRPNRVHLASVELDLCNLPSVLAAADQLVGGTVAVYTGLDGKAVDAQLPRLDVIVCNAGIGGWTGLDWGALAVNFLTMGLLQATTYPTCKAATVGLAVDPLTGREVKLSPGGGGKATADSSKSGAATAVEANGRGAQPETLGQVFCANVFGHYVFTHALLPLLTRPSAEVAEAVGGPARLVWESSVEATCWDYLKLDDLQGLGTDAAYESSKRLTDVLSLTSGLPGVVPFSKKYWSDDGGRRANGGAAGTPVPPQPYLTHPGVVCSTLFPLPFLLFYVYNFAMYLARWCGSPWHPVTAYKGALAAVWIALQPTAGLDHLQATHIKWGSSTTAGGETLVKKTEVEGWGWTGRSGAEADDPARQDKGIWPSALRLSKGRRWPLAPKLTDERRQEFELLGRDCWREMERLRTYWEPQARAVLEAKESK